MVKLWLVKAQLKKTLITWCVSGRLLMSSLGAHNFYEKSGETSTHQLR